MGISVILLAYHEEENLKLLLPQINHILAAVGEDYEILVIDTAVPTDHTEHVCALNGASYIKQQEPYFGGAFRTAIQCASKDKFLILDSDGSHDPEKIPALLDKFNTDRCDVVIGSRYVKGGVTNDKPSSIIMSRILNNMFRLCLGIRAKDISTDYRLYRTSQLKQVTLKCKNYDILQEVLLKLKLNKKNLTIGEVPITFNKRLYGESKRKLLPFILSYIKTLANLTFIRIISCKQFILYILFGLCAALLEYGIFSSLILLKMLPEYSNIIGALSGFCFTFSCNTFFNFQKRDRLLRRFISYGLICLSGIGLSTLLITLFKNTMNIYLLKFLCMVLVACIQFTLNKVITYRD